MKNPVYEQIQARKVKARLRMLQHAQRISGNVSQTCRFFGVSPVLYSAVSSRPETTGCSSGRSRPLCPVGCEVRSPRWKGASALLSIHGY